MGDFNNVLFVDFNRGKAPPQTTRGGPQQAGAAGDKQTKHSRSLAPPLEALALRLRGSGPQNGHSKRSSPETHLQLWVSFNSGGASGAVIARSETNGTYNCH